jgi:hypothetical protein
MPPCYIVHKLFTFCAIYVDNVYMVCYIVYMEGRTMKNWNPENIFSARDRDVLDKSGNMHMVRLYSDGWKIGSAEGMDVWQAVRLLNEMEAS